MAPVDREVLLPLQKTLALPSSSHLVAPLLFLQRQTAPAHKKKKNSNGQIGNVVFSCGFDFLAQAQHSQTRREIGFRKEERGNEGSWLDMLRQRGVSSRGQGGWSGCSSDGGRLDRHVHAPPYRLWCWGMESIVVGVDRGEI